MADQQPTLDEAKVMAARAGLPLTDDELKGLLPGIGKNREQTADLRGMLAKTDEPAGVFDANTGGTPRA